MDSAPPGVPAIPPRRLAPRPPIPPVPSRWDMCDDHQDNRHIAICKTCVHFLCKECMMQHPLKHARCEVSSLDTNLYSTCEEMTSQLSRKLKTSKHTIQNFHRRLSKKRDRMIKKRNETVVEIERYFGMLKERLLRKLKHDETMLLNHLNEKVSEQDELISKSIDDCSEIMDSIEEKRAVISNLERQCSSQRGNSAVSFLKNVVKNGKEIDAFTDSEASLEATRDAFLVIRFYVDSEAEKAALRSKVASVEVLNSQDNDISGSNLESEGINEASQNVCMDVESELNFMDADNTEELRVALPPAISRLANTSPSQSSERSGDSPTIPVCDIGALASGSSRTSPITDHTSGTSSAEGERGLTETQAQTQTETKQALVDVPDSRTSSQRSSPTTSCAAAELDSSQTEAETSTSSSVAVQQENSPPCMSTPVHEDPPPPYPGFPRIQPRPNELPPPYPGPPPPPYTQSPEPSSRPENFRQSRLLESDESREQAVVAINPTIQNESPSTSGLKFSKVFSVNEIHDKRSAGIFALAVVRSNCFVVVDRWNKKLKYFNPSGASFGGLIFREEPWDVTLLTADLVAVTVPKLNTLYKIKVTEQSVVTTSTVTTVRKYACVSFHKSSERFICGQVPQFGEPVIDVIDINGGTILQTFRQDSDTRDRCMFSYPRYVKVTDEGIVIVCDWNLKCLLLFKLDGSFVGRYKGTIDFPLNEPTGMAYDEEKQEIYVIDSKFSSLSAAIHTVTLSCECKDIMIWDNELRVAPAISPCRPGFAVGSKSGLVGLFTARQSRASL